MIGLALAETGSLGSIPFLLSSSDVVKIESIEKGHRTWMRTNP